MTFLQAFQQTDVAACIEPGIQALGQYAHLIECENQRGLQRSVDIDRCLAEQYPQDHRWDYAFGYRQRIIYVEVHHVSDSEVQMVIAKYRWLRDWQNRQANPHSLKANSEYHWLSSGKGSLTKNSRFSRSLIHSGLDFPQRILHI